MGKKSRWIKLKMKCPEGRGEHELLVELRAESGKEGVNSISCNNLHLRDLSGGDCQWTCWEQVSEYKE